MENKIVIVGAGYSGVIAAKKLAKIFKKNKDVSVTLIDKNPFHTMLTELHEVAAGRVEEDSIKLSLKKIFAGRKVHIKQDVVTNIDFGAKTVVGKNESYNYDYLVIAAGSRPAFYGVEGAEEFSFKLWSYEDAVILKDHIRNSFRKAVKVTDLAEKKRLLTFHVVGAGFTGVEMAGELAEYVPVLCDQYEMEKELVSIYIVDVLARAIPILPEKLSNKVERRLSKMGVEMMLSTCVEKIGKDFIETSKDTDCQTKTTGTVIWAAGIESSSVTLESAKALSFEKGGRLKVDKFLRSVDNESIYVVGDNMFYIPEGEEETVPQMVENCEKSAVTAAKNIARAILGNKEMIPYRPKFHGVMVSVGGRYGVARVGASKHMYNLPSFFAMFTKHLINMIYFIQVLGWNKIFSYMKHEFFTIRNCRSFVGGHFSNRTPSFLLVPLRIWLGAVWLFEGITKIFQGWLQSPRLTAFFGGANAWYEAILKNAAEHGVTEAVSTVTGASESVTSATDVVVADWVGTLIFRFNFLRLFEVIFVSGRDLVNSTLGDYAFKLDVPLMNWVINTLILPNDSMQIFMQAFIVIAEILIGLALIAGLFTFPASAFSLVLQFMFVCTTGLYLGTFWMIFAAIAVLIGAGRTFGLDYYAMPYVKHTWRKLPLIRKLYIYND